MKRFVFAALLGSLCLMGCDSQVVYQKSVATLNQKAQALMRQGDFAKAIERLESAKELNPKEPHTRYNLALAYQQNNQPKQAIQELEPLIDDGAKGLERDIASLYQDLGVMYEAWADEARSQDPSLPSPDIAPKPAADPQWKLHVQQRLEKAIWAYQQGLSAGSTNPKPLEERVTLLQDDIKALYAPKPKGAL